MTNSSQGGRLLTERSYDPRELRVFYCERDEPFEKGFVLLQMGRYNVVKRARAKKKHDLEKANERQCHGWKTPLSARVGDWE